MRMKSWSTSTAAATVLLVISALSAAPQAGPAKDLPDQQCRLTLPDDTWQWRGDIPARRDATRRHGCERRSRGTRARHGRNEE